MSGRRHRNAMITKWKLLIYSLASMVMAAIVCMAGALLQSVVMNPRGSLRVADLFYLAGFALVFGFVGWVVTAPMVLKIKNIAGWRFWLYWALGSSFGPLSMFAVFALVFFLVPGSPDAHWIRPELMPLVYLATAISSLAALFYLLLLRRAQVRLR
jgi:ABC-type Fe3+-siderophore transport system permease subunit